MVNKKGIGVGLQIPSVCISSSKVSDNEFIISFGNVYQEMPYGFYKVSFDKVKGNQSITKNVIADFPEKNSSYNISSGNNGIYIFDSLHSFANNVFFMRLK